MHDLLVQLCFQTKSASKVMCDTRFTERKTLQCILISSFVNEHFALWMAVKMHTTVL